MAIIGENSSVGMGGASVSSTSAQMLMYGFGTYVAEANQEVFRVAVLSGLSTGVTVDVTVYDVTDGYANAPLAGYGTVTTTTASVFNTADITPFTLVQGRTYAVGRRTNGSGSLGRTYQGAGVGRYSTDIGTDAISATFNDGTPAEHRFGLYAETQTATVTPSIDSMDDPIRMGQSNSHTVSGFTPNAGSVSANSITLSATSANATSQTYPGLSQGLVIPEPAATGITRTLTDGTNSPTDSGGFAVTTGWTFNSCGTISGSLTEDDWGFGLGLTSSDGYVTNDSESGIATHNDDGTTTWLTTGTVQLFSWDETAVVGSDGGLTEINLTNSAPDMTAPILTSPTAVATGETTASGSVTTDEANGTIYYLASVNATESPTNIKAASSQVVSATGVQNVTFTGLTQNTSYYAHYIHTDAAGNDSVAVVSAQFTTDATPDTIPDAFAFTDVTGAALSTVTESSIETITGIDTPTAISVTAGEYRINGGAYTATAGNVSNNDAVQLRITSSASYSTAVSTTVDIGGVTDLWSVTTQADVQPYAGGSAEGNSSIISAIAKSIVRNK